MHEEYVNGIENGYQKIIAISRFDSECEKRIDAAEAFLRKNAIKIPDQMDCLKTNYLLNGANVRVRREYCGPQWNRLLGFYGVEITAETKEKISQIEKILFPIEKIL